MSARPGFSLVEALTLLAVIATLLAVLLPATARHRALARAAECTANLRQIGLSVRLYGQDYQGVFPETVSTADGALQAAGIPWHRALMPYMANFNSGEGLGAGEAGRDYRGRGIYYICPESRLPVTGLWHSTYAVHNVLFKPANAPQMRPGQVKLAEVRRPAAIAIIGDATQSHDGGWAWDTFWNTYNAPFEDPNDLQTPCDEDNPDTDGAAGWVRYRHRGTCNLLFVDGHVETRTRGSLRYADFAYDK